MRTLSLFRLSLLILAFSLILAACRDEGPLPTAVPTAIVPDAIEENPPTPTPKAPADDAPPPAIDPEDIDWPPQVIYSSPAPGEETLLDGAITVRFDQPMDSDSVEAVFAVEPAVSGSFAWPRTDTVVFTPRGSLKRQQQYRVHIGAEAKGENGLALQSGVELNLQTVGFLEVSQVIPGDGVTDVQTDGAITVLFNRPVVPLVSSGQQAGLPQPLTLEPPVAGEGQWVSTSIYRFVPDEPFAGATTYRARIAAGLEDVTGGLLADDYAWEFTTLRPSVVSVEPANGATLVDPEGPITITFNMPMDRASTESGTSLRSATSVARLIYGWSDDDRALTITPQNRLELANDYQVGVSQAALSANGAASLDQDTISGFTTVPFPAVASTEPAQGEVAERWQRGVSINFASPMDWATLDGRITIDPQPERFTYHFFGPDSPTMSLDFRLEEDAAYTVTIPGDAADPYGNTLGRDYILRFTTPEGAPLASFNLPSQISQISTGFTTQVDIIHRNVSQLEVSLYELGLPFSLINEPYNVQDYRPAAQSLRTWSLPVSTSRGEVDVAALPLVDEGALAAGVYLLTVDAPEIADDTRYWQNQRHLLIVADANIVVKEMFGETHVWVTDLASGQPASGRDLALYNVRGTEVDTAVSDDNGFARFDTPITDHLAGVTVVSGQPGAAGFGVGRSAWNEGVSPWEFGLDSSFSPEPPTFAYVYTDRPIYRPGDTIYYKGIVRNSNYGRYAPPSAQTLTMRINAAFFF